MNIGVDVKPGFSVAATGGPVADLKQPDRAAAVAGADRVQAHQLGIGRGQVMEQFGQLVVGQVAVKVKMSDFRMHSLLLR